MKTCQPAIARWEKSMREGRLPTLDTLVRYCEAIGITFELHFVEMSE